MANNGIPASIARLNDLTNRIRGGDNLSQQDAYEILYFTQAEDVPGDNTPEVVRVLELIQRMQNGPTLNEDEINEVLRLRKTRFANQVAGRAVSAARARPVGGPVRAERAFIYEMARRIVIEASNNEDPGLVEQRANAAVNAFLDMTPEERQRIVRPLNEAPQRHGQGVNCMEVHRVAATFRDKLPLIAGIIRTDLGEVGERTQYPSLIAHLDATVGHCISESPIFESKNKPNSSEKRDRSVWKVDYSSVRQALERALVSMSEDHVKFSEDILDFVFKYTLEECFVSTFVYDSAHAYEGNARANETSCPGGVAERIYTTLFDCIKGSNEGVFGELNKILQGEIKSWEDLDRATKKAYIENWNTFFQKWTQENLGNPEIQRMKSAQLTQAILSAYKSRPGEPPVPKVFEEYLSTQFFPSLVWKDYGFNSDNSANPQGGRRTRYKKKRNRKITRRNRNKNKKNKSLKAR
jgi:hypothetical protein